MEGPLLKIDRYGGITKGSPQYQGTPGNGHLVQQLMRWPTRAPLALAGDPLRVLNPLHRELARVLHFYCTKARYPPNSMNDCFMPESREEERKPSPPTKVQLSPVFHILKSAWVCELHLTVCREGELGVQCRAASWCPEYQLPLAQFPKAPRPMLTSKKKD